MGSQVVNWQHTLEQKWAGLHFGEVKVESRGEQHLFEVQVFLNELDPEAVRVELCADGVSGSAPVRQEMKLLSRRGFRRACRRQPARALGRLRYRQDRHRGCVCGPPTGGLYRLRVIPHGTIGVCKDSHWKTLARILWQR